MLNCVGLAVQCVNLPPKGLNMALWCEQWFLTAHQRLPHAQRVSRAALWHLFKQRRQLVVRLEGPIHQCTQQTSLIVLPKKNRLFDLAKNDLPGSFPRG